jgi:hypothetical protein
MPLLRVTGGPIGPSGRTLTAGTSLAVRYFDTYVDGSAVYPRLYEAELDTSTGGWKPAGSSNGTHFFVPGGASGEVMPPECVLIERQVYVGGDEQTFARPPVRIYATGSGVWFYPTPAPGAVFVTDPGLAPVGAVLQTQLGIPGGPATLDGSGLLSPAQRAGYSFLQRVAYDAPGSYGFLKASYPSLRLIVVHLLGAGGGGGGCATTSAGQAAIGGGGGGGAYVAFIATDVANVPSSAAVEVGAGGAGGLAGVNTGGAGGLSSFQYTSVATVTAAGGNGGMGSAAFTPPGGVSALGGNRGNGSNIGSASALVSHGDAGSEGLALSATRLLGGVGGRGGGPIGGAPGQIGSGVQGEGVSAPARVFGCGGNGGRNQQSQATAQAGGAGGHGLVILDLYA